MPVDSTRVQSIFQAALRKPAAERASFLDQACGPNTELRCLVEELLAAHDGADSQNAEPVTVLDATRTAVPLLKSTIAYIGPSDDLGTLVVDRYKLLQRIGEGGMGTVFMAEQTQPVKRLVALKVVKAGMDSRSVLARFEAERQALALMDHPHIAKVLDAGSTELGQPFFVMELVKGVPLTQFCDEHQLSIDARLQVFQNICHAVQHAHQKGIIHRDLKPTNILVESHDGKPVAKVIDFGLAKAMHTLALTDRSLYTQFGAVMGTPLYMAPEQAEFSAIDVDTRADVYALGVILYELLTGTTPLEKKRLAQAGWDEVRRIIREEEPPKPSGRLSTLESRTAIAANRRSEPHKLIQVVRGDLDWIVMKALAKERDRRYETANAFAADVQRYLRQEPVSAGPPTLRYKLRKFVQRNRAGVIVAATLALLLLLGGVGLVVGIVAVRAEQQRTEQALAKVTAEEEKTRQALAKVIAEEEKTRQALAAERIARKETHEALNAMTDDVIEKVFARQPQMDEDERAFLKKVLGFYEVFAAQKGETEEARRVAADGQLRVAKVRAFLGERADAITGFREAIRLLTPLVAEFPNLPDCRHDLAGSYTNLGNQLQGLGKSVEVEAAYRQALTILENLVADFPRVPNYHQSLAGAHNNLGLFLKESRQRQKAEEHFRRALKILEKLVAQFPPARQSLAYTHNNLAILLREARKHPEAESHYHKALAIKKKLMEEYRGVPAFRQEFATNLNNLGSLLVDMGQIPRAEATYRQALEIQKKLAAEFPTVPPYQLDLAMNYYNRGNLLPSLGKFPEAEASYRQALLLFAKLDADSPTVPDYRAKLALTHNNLAALVQEMGNRPEAEVHFRQALAIQEKLTAKYPNQATFRTDLAGTCVNFGSQLRRQNRAQDSLAWFDRAIPLLETNLSKDPRSYQDRLYLRNAHLNRTLALKDLRRYADAVKDWDQAIELEPGPDRVGLRLQRVAALARAGDHARAAAEIDDLTRDAKIKGDTLYEAARVCGLAVQAVKDNATLKEQYAGKALALLRRARDAGFFDAAPQVERLKKDDDLAALRDGADFQQFVTDLDKKLAPPGKSSRFSPPPIDGPSRQDSATSAARKVIR